MYNNPQAAYNGMLSGQRNMFLLSSVGVVMIGFIKNKQSAPTVLYIAAIAILLMSAFIGVHASRDFEFFLNNMLIPLPACYSEKRWRQWKYVAYIYGLFLLGLVFYLLIEFSK